MLALLSVATLFTVAACGADDNPGSTTNTMTTMTTVETATASQTPGASVDKPDPTPPAGTSAAPLQPLGDPSQEPKIQAADGAFDLSVTGVRVAEHEAFTRVVFDIGGDGLPGWWVDYQDAPRQQASGLPVEVTGDSYLEVNLDGIALPMDAAEPGVEIGSFDGAGIVEEITLTTIFEAQAQFFIGVAGVPRDYSVTLLQDPTRVVVDLIH